MTTEPAEIAAPDLPEDPAVYARRPRGLGLGFWALMLLCFLCVVAGVVVARYGPSLFPARTQPPPPHAQPSAPSPEVQALNARIAELQAQLAQAQAARPAPAPGPSASDFSDLDTRLGRLEAGQRRSFEAAAAALAGASLADAARSSQPFPKTLARVADVLPDSPDLRALRSLAETGAPSRLILTSEYPAAAARAAVAARAPAGDGGFLARAAQALASIVVIRRTDRLSGDGPDAVLARAQQRLDEGDLDGALTALDRLPPAGRDAIAPWRAHAQRRLEIDRHVAAIRDRALASLTAAAPGAELSGAAP